MKLFIKTFFIATPVLGVLVHAITKLPMPWWREAVRRSPIPIA